MKPAAIVGWTGNGALDDLARTALSKLPGEVEVTQGARSLLVRGGDPVVVARRLAHLPGTSWVAVGYQFEGLAGCLSNLAVLAKRYLEEGASFKVSAEVEESGKEEGDVLMEATSTLLKSAKGSHVDEKNPKLWFRVVMVKDSGACGVQLREGDGGVPTSRKMDAACLVSGGYHSAVTAWMAALSGFSLTLVHARDDDESLRQAARLYAELSQRIDASSLRLEVLEGEGTAGDRVLAWLEAARGDVFTGVHPECRGMAGMELLRRYPPALFPLLLVQEGEIRSRLDGLNIRGKTVDREAKLSASKGKKEKFSVKAFGGREADQNDVLDSILG
ncbi:MAG: hypothetical protein OK474_03930 [Thaumarchaeota archaeon]|nr:hypothetical protein [Nitrososphaerota archaeon]